MVRRRRKRGGAVAVAAAVVAIAAWLHPGLDLGYRGDTVAIAAPAPSGDLATLLDQIRVVDRIDDVPGYERSCKKGKACVFGPAWNDPTDHTGCDTRSRVLQRDLRDTTFKAGTRNCKVIAGWLQDPYSGERVDLDDVEIDHTVSLHRAWNAGAWQWDPTKRQIFANDLTELRALSSSVNQAKSDATLDEWSPSLPESRCLFAKEYLAVNVKYDLPITVSEKTAAINACA
ncbi:HNH endonuclease (plasmid) [Mycolicibacterium frederiksbergense]|uniref:HNH endonuclease n=1 Tax=Mycolicibacterium frederiksbergense TaxID=117567 RepID=A0A6H0RXD6_9MYCO|nr:HNH endonuclease [Mycolicibacterium frederiksbergense]